MQRTLNNNSNSNNTKEQEDAELLEIFAADILKKFSEWLNGETRRAESEELISDDDWGASGEARLIRNKLFEFSMGWIDSAYNVREAYGPNETQRRPYKPGSGQFENLT